MFFANSLHGGAKLGHATPPTWKFPQKKRYFLRSILVWDHEKCRFL